MVTDNVTMTDIKMSELSLLLMTALNKMVIVRRKNSLLDCESSFIIVEEVPVIKFISSGIETYLVEGRIIDQIAEAIGD
jgi:hypothetical protein